MDPFLSPSPIVRRSIFRQKRGVIGRAWLALLFCPVLAHAAVGDESVGVNVHDGAPELIAAAAALGVRWVRLDGNWFSHEPANNQYQWVLDNAVQNASQAGLSAFITLAYTPGWVPRHGDSDGSSHNDVPNTSAEWVDFVRAAVTHYRALGVRHFGLWNEANLRGFFEGTVQEYTSLIVIPGAQAIRAVCADCVVLGPDLAHVGDADDYLESVLAAIPAGTFDILTHHTYNDFAETGWQIWDGDSFINVLDDQRFPFTRRSLRQILDAAGYQGEVWITETGYRALPGDQAEENLQAIYVRRALEEQLQRAWYTNTFFYEMNDCGIDQPGCTIDGFGLLRPTGGVPGSRQFPNNFRIKPAFTAISDFIRANPRITGAQPPSQCGDGQDNDGDGRTDGADRGCADAQDNDESDDPPRTRYLVRRISPPQIDGRLDEALALTPLSSLSWQGTEPLGGPADLSAQFFAGYSATGLWLGLVVTDDTHQNNNPADALWMADSLQIAFDTQQNGGTGYDADDHELNFGLTPAGPLSYRFHGPPGAPSQFPLQIQRGGATTTYEILIPPEALPGFNLFSGNILGFSFLINENDGDGRVGWLEWTPGIGTQKEPEYFGELQLIDEVLDAGPADFGFTTDALSPDTGHLDAPPTPDALTTYPDAQPLDAGFMDAALGDANAEPLPAEGCGCQSYPGQSYAPWGLGVFWAARRRKK